MHQALEETEKRLALAREAAAEAKRLLDEADKLLGDIKRTPSNPSIDNLVRSFIADTCAPSTRVLLAGALLEVSIAADRETPSESEHAGRAEAVAMAEALERGATMYRVLYNLACFWSSLARHLDLEAPRTRAGTVEARAALARSYTNLERALHNAPHPAAGKIARWALEDPSLIYLRNHKECAARVVGLLRIYAERPAPASGGELGQLEVVGRFGATQLKQVGIQSPKDLPRLATPVELAPPIARKLGLPIGLVRTWIGAVELLSLPAITPSQVNAFVNSGVAGLKDLAGQDTFELQNALAEQHNRIAGSPVPSIDQLGKWIVAARKRVQASSKEPS